MRKRIDYPMGSISSGTMRAEDLIPCFLAELEWLSGKTRNSSVAHKTRVEHRKLVREIELRIDGITHAPAEFDRRDAVTQTACKHCGLDIENLKPYKVDDWRDRGNNTHCAFDYYEDGDSDTDLCELFDALGEYAAPYFYFGSHPGDGSDYGFWLSEDWDEDFPTLRDGTLYDSCTHRASTLDRNDPPNAIKVSDSSEIPSWFHGEVAVISDHGNVSLYVKTSRSLREIWSVV